MSVLYIRDSNGNFSPVPSLQGEPGADGADGYSILTFNSVTPPDFVAGDLNNIVAVSDIATNGRGIQIKDLLVADGWLYRVERFETSDTISVKKVRDLNGSDGKNGVSPTITVSKTGTVTTITITDANDTKIVKINDGTNGKDYVLTDADMAAIAALVKPLLKTETWTFELEDGTVVTKEVMLA